ncbi:sugar kinase [Solibacillus sp. R5-41]|uniref:ROK family transcriptional regulator n=1 Tax=Solibacillus sp. R5-41 TaxID=2048654 RepID=UPI000C1296AA|nr:ROK family transcriptional regulator [Solibacillus sp. R5-41]ATP41106.1 sugar kinase [Solibacillus sp. R5-41]
MKKQDQMQMKKQNKYIVLDAIRQMAPVSRIQLSKYTKMSPTTITRIVQELELEGFLYEGQTEETLIGRRPTLIHLRGDALFTIGIEIDSFVIKIGIVDFIGELIDFTEVKCNVKNRYEDALDIIQHCVNELLEANAISKEKLQGIGIGIPGVINHDEGIVLSSEQLLWKNCKIASDLKERFDCDIVVDNELKMQILAEIGDVYAPTFTNCILVGIGTGIGASILLDGELYRGTHNRAGEISHITVNLDGEGEQCHCGKRGCLSLYISERSLLKRAPENIDSIEQLAMSMISKEQWALKIQQDVAKYLAAAINNLACLYEPEAIIVSGEMVEHNELFQQELRDMCSQYIWSEIHQHFDLQFSNQSKVGVVKGAALQIQKQVINYASA